MKSETHTTNGNNVARRLLFSLYISVWLVWIFEAFSGENTLKWEWLKTDILSLWSLYADGL